MSITGYSQSLRNRVRRSDLFPEPSQIERIDLQHTGLEPFDVSSEKFWQPLATAPSLNFPRRPSHLLANELNLVARANRLPHPRAATQDDNSKPRTRTNLKVQARPNEISRIKRVVKSSDGLARAKKPGIVVIHPREFFRDCFVRCLDASYKSHDVAAFANINAWRASSIESANNPSVIVFFVDSSNVSSMTDLQFLEAVATDTPVVIVSDIDDANYVVRALKGGARGYIPTSLSFNVAVEAVRLVEAGGTFVPVSSLVLDRSKQQQMAKTGDLLTERQMMVVEALCQGMANKQIAYELGMSEHTVKVHLRHIMRKLRARNRTEVAVLTKDFFERPHEQKRSGADDSPH